MANCIPAMCSPSRSHWSQNFNRKLIIEAVQIIDSNKITCMMTGSRVRELQLACMKPSGLYFNYIVTLPAMAPYHVRKVDFDKKFSRKQFSLRKLMVSHDLLRLPVANQITFDQRDSKSIPKFERTMDRCCHAAGFQIGNLRYHHFYSTELYCFVLKIEWCIAVKNAKLIMTFKDFLETFSQEKRDSNTAKLLSP